MSLAMTDSWETVAQTAKRLGITRQGLHWRMNKGQVPEEFVEEVTVGGRTVILISPEYGEEKVSE